MKKTEIEKLLKKNGHHIDSFGVAIFPELPANRAKSRGRRIAKHQRAKLTLKVDLEVALRVCKELGITYDKLKQIY